MYHVRPDDPQVGTNLPLWDVVQHLCSTDPTQESCPTTVDNTDQEYICPE